MTILRLLRRLVVSCASVSSTARFLSAINVRCTSRAEPVYDPLALSRYEAATEAKACKCAQICSTKQPECACADANDCNDGYRLRAGSAAGGPGSVALVSSSDLGPHSLASSDPDQPYAAITVSGLPGQGSSPERATSGRGA